ncbi:MAG: hypothetical protein ABIU63_10860 [Chitinophagaceae bacterium]
MHTLIFCLSSDIVGGALYNLLFHQGERNLRVVTDTDLAFASWLHEAGSDGKFFTRIHLRDGFIIEPAMIKNVVHRIPYFQLVHFINPVDRSYAEMEMYALYISFLRSVKEKVVDGMHTRHINNTDNALFFYAMAVKAGLEVLENTFTSSPRWQQPKALTAVSPRKKTMVAWHKRTRHLVWENKPVMYNEPFTSIVKLEVVGKKFFSGIGIPEKMQAQVNLFSSLIGRTVYEISLAEVNKTYKLYAVNTRPPVLSEPALEAFSLLLTSKNKN